VDGIKGSELIKFRMWQKSSNAEFSNVTVTYSTDPSGAGRYMSTGIYVLSAPNISLVSAIEGEVVFGANPKQYALLNAFPNPFNPSTAIRFDVPREVPVMLEIYSIVGIRVRTLLKGENVAAGTHVIVWEGHDEGGRLTP